MAIIIAFYINKLSTSIALSYSLNFSELTPISKRITTLYYNYVSWTKLAMHFFWPSVCLRFVVVLFVSLCTLRCTSTFVLAAGHRNNHLLCLTLCKMRPEIIVFFLSSFGHYLLLLLLFLLPKQMQSNTKIKNKFGKSRRKWNSDDYCFFFDHHARFNTIYNPELDLGFLAIRSVEIEEDHFDLSFILVDIYRM